MQQWQVRPVRVEDLDSVELLIVQMFADLGTTSVPASWSAAWRHHLMGTLGGDAAGFIVSGVHDVPVSVAVGVVDQRLPSPRRPSGRIGYVEWLATERDHRGQGAGRAALGGLLSWFDGRGVDVVDVHSSPGAVALYEDQGFSVPKAPALRRHRPQRH